MIILRSQDLTSFYFSFIIKIEYEIGAIKMPLSNIQKRIVEAKEKKIVVISSAASGKTTVLTERVKYLLDNGANKDKTVVITFTNAAADEMRERIGDKYCGLFIGTIHSYANYLLLSSGIDTGKIIDNEDFDLLFPLIEQHPEVIKKVDNLLLDEAQDTDESQFKFMIEMINPDSYFIVGDFRQSIYGFRGARPDLLLDLTYDWGVKTYELNENYRNGLKILNFAKRIIKQIGYDYEDNSICKSDIMGSVHEISFNLNTIGKAILKDGNFKDWFILTRTNADLDLIYDGLEKMGIPCDTFKRSELTSDELNERMKNNTVKVLTIHTSKGLENKKVIVVGAQFFNSEEKRISYVAATRAKELLVWCSKPKRYKPKIQNWE